MSSPTCFVFFRSGQATLDDAARRLAGSGLRVDHGGDHLAVRSGDGPVLRIRHARDPRVAVEAREFSAKTPHAVAMRDCDARFEVTFDDLSIVLDEVNTLIEVQMTLQEATGGFLYTSWNGALTAA